MVLTRTAWDDCALALRAHLMTYGDWGDRVGVEHVEASTPRPYVIIYFVGGGRLLESHSKDANLLVGVKCVADTLGLANQGAFRIMTLLEDNGEGDKRTDSTATPVVAGEFEILTITEERALAYAEDFEKTRNIYHAGFVYRIRMEER